MALLKIADGVSRVHASRRVFDVLAEHNIDIPVIHHRIFPAGMSLSLGTSLHQKRISLSPRCMTRLVGGIGDLLETFYGALSLRLFTSSFPGDGVCYNDVDLWYIGPMSSFHCSKYSVVLHMYLCSDISAVLGELRSSCYSLWIICPGQARPVTS